MDITRAQEAIVALLGAPAQSVTRIGRGGNSKVYRVVGDDGTTYVAKCYFQRTMDGRDRLEVEFKSLRFLWDHGERCVPEPLKADRTSQVALYEYIDGTAIESRHASDADLEQLVSFATRLHRLSGIKQADALPPAAEACFSFSALHENLLGRLERLNAVQGEDASYVALRRFLWHGFVPALDRVVDEARARMGEAALHVELPRDSWTLSPSDFGFHNALRRPDGTIVFIDFEYFGKDDPAKLIADFVLHPAMQLSDTFARGYVERMLACFSGDHKLPDRLASTFPMFGLKWCMILLNEFVPKFLERREFAVEADTDREHVRARQLTKASRMLERVLHGPNVVAHAG